MGLNAYDEIYEEYIDNILSISSLSDKEHYIFYNFNIKDNVCYDEVYMLNKNGEKGKLGNKNFNYNDEFYEKFIRNLVDRFDNANNIKSKDIVYDDEGVGTFRMITDNMDIFTICGLSKNQNEELLDMIDYKNCSEVNPEIKNDIIIDNTGKVNYLLVVFFIIVLVLFIITLIILL